ncbi:hypothetical protein NM688_g5615 [Phlebia brevispora]|uniref:Uncharacterized protein n=1 Tax=Phlebia brevispora TaxID=194682 RepID=A0ACC1SSC2_9APHY|nr:hypothetical protein NM688_g5615 [Phlebia brevispora]
MLNNSDCERESPVSQNSASTKGLFADKALRRSDRPVMEHLEPRENDLCCQYLITSSPAADRESSHTHVPPSLGDDGADGEDAQHQALGACLSYDDAAYAILMRCQPRATEGPSASEKLSNSKIYPVVEGQFPRGGAPRRRNSGSSFAEAEYRASRQETLRRRREHAASPIAKDAPAGQEFCAAMADILPPADDREAGEGGSRCQHQNTNSQQSHNETLSTVVGNQGSRGEIPQCQDPGEYSLHYRIAYTTRAQGLTSSFVESRFTNGEGIIEGVFPSANSRNSIESEWRCRYLAGQESAPVLNPSIFRDMHVHPSQTDFWTRRLYEGQRARITAEPREVTIYSDEELHDSVVLEVPVQVKHTTTNPVISSSLASVPCVELGVDGLLKELNQLSRTSYSKDEPGLLPILQQCIGLRYDFGTAFGRLRRSWFDGDFTTLPQRLEKYQDEDTHIRGEALDRARMVVKSLVPPRRVWDLYSNRIVPVWALGGLRHVEHIVSETQLAPRQVDERHDPGFIRIWGISHSWVDDRERHNVDTPINEHEWLVPIPRTVTLDRIRVELLNLGAEYVWLDVLCLRQQDSSKAENEALREEEWQLDVPTIGSIYRNNSYVVTYFEGLGRPFHLSDIRGDRHWINRTWTLQEASRRTYVGGLTPSSPFPPPSWDLDGDVKQFYIGLGAMIEGTNPEREMFAHVELCAMTDLVAKRKSSFRMDKVAGLAYRLYSKDVPAYCRGKDEEEDVERVWCHLASMMDERCQLQLVLKYPTPGDGERTWRPTWRQLTSGETSLPHVEEVVGDPVYVGATMQEDGSIELPALVLDNCIIRNLNAPDGTGCCRRGVLSLAGNGKSSGPSLELRVTAHHQHPISDKQKYVLVAPRPNEWLLSSRRYIHKDWMIGRYDENSRRIKKVSVLELDGDDGRLKDDLLGLRELGLLGECKVTLL